MFASIAALAGLEVKRVTIRTIRVVLLLLVALVFAFAGIFYGFAALGAWLSAYYPPVVVTLILAGMSVGLALSVALGAFALHRAPPDRSAAKQAAALIAAPVALKALRGLPGIGTLLPLVVLAGFMVGRMGARE